MNSDRIEIRVTGFGGQGVVLSAYIIGRAAIDVGKHATMMQSFGPEARGASCSATLAISDREVLYPYIQRPDVLVVMSSDGYATFGKELKDDGILIYESDLVHPEGRAESPSYVGRALSPPAPNAFGIPSTRIAERVAKPMVQNIVMLGFITAVTNIVPREAMREAVRLSVPAGTEEMNLRAFDEGFAYLESQVEVTA